jgi:predicted protein tyrosine phosphatase
MIIEVMNRSKAKAESYRQEAIPTAIISITDVDAPINVFNHPKWLKGILRLQFDDVEGQRQNHMTNQNARDIKQFIEQIKSQVERVIVHCEAGISRSSGVAAAIMKYIDGDDMLIFKNGRFCPNMHCYRITLNALMGQEPDETECITKEAENIKVWNKLFNDWDKTYEKE